MLYPVRQAPLPVLVLELLIRGSEIDMAKCRAEEGFALKAEKIITLIASKPEMRRSSQDKASERKSEKVVSACRKQGVRNQAVILYWDN
jgi:hypothetical protein